VWVSTYRCDGGAGRGQSDMMTAKRKPEAVGHDHHPMELFSPEKEFQ